MTLLELEQWHQHQLDFIPADGAPADLHRAAISALQSAKRDLAIAQAVDESWTTFQNDNEATFVLNFLDERAGELLRGEK